MVSRLLPLLSVAAIFGGAYLKPAAAVVIDDFSVGPVTVTGEGASSSQTSLDPAHVIGGRRDISIENAGTTVQVETGKQRFHVTNPSVLGYYRLMYGLGGSLGADFTAGGHDRIRFRFVDAGAANNLWTYVNSSLPPGSNGLDIGNAVNALLGYGVVEVPFSLYNTNFATVNTFALWQVRKPTGHYAIEEISTAGPPPAGDYNRDGLVDSGDYNEWRRLYGKTVSGGVLIGPDGDANGRIDVADYVLWRKSLGAGAAASVSSVPEPSFQYVLCIALLGMIRFSPFTIRGIPRNARMA